MKPGFILYNDYYGILSTLSDEELGKLLRAIFNYEVDGKIQKLNNTLLMAFNFIKKDLDYGKEKYDKTCERNRINGAKGGRPKDSTNNPLGFSITHNNPLKPKKPNINININKNINKKNKKTPIKTYTDKGLTLDQVAEKIIVAFNINLKRNFKLSKGIIPNIEYWLDVYTPREVELAIRNIKKDDFWLDKMTPTILFRRKNPQGEPVDYISQLLNSKEDSWTK